MRRQILRTMLTAAVVLFFAVRPNGPAEPETRARTEWANLVAERGRKLAELRSYMAAGDGLYPPQLMGEITELTARIEVVSSYAARGGN